MGLPLILFIVFAMLWLLLAWKPKDAGVWWLENIAVFLALPFLLWAFRAGLLSSLSAGALFAFGVLHISAAHYSYARTPWGNWLRRVFRLRRNPYDRIVHFLYGLLAVPVFNDLLTPALSANPFLHALVVFCVISSLGALYEIAEFTITPLVKRPDMEFLGAQGDVWDAQKDMLMQACGALLGLAAILLFF